MKNEDLVGVWRERGREIVRADGSLTADVARASQIMYSPDGYMAVVNTPIARKPVAETVARMDLDATTPEQRAAAELAARQPRQSFPHPLAARREDVGFGVSWDGSAAAERIPAGQIAPRRARI